MRFQLNFSIVDIRNWRIDRDIGSLSQAYSIRFNAFTGRYLISNLNIGTKASLASIQEVEGFFSEIKNLTFSPVDRSKYPCYDFSIDYIKKGKLYISALSILDEILVNLFLDEKISYVSIPLYLEKFLDQEKFDQNFTIDNIIEVREYLTKKVFKELKI